MLRNFELLTMAALNVPVVNKIVFVVIVEQ